METRKDNPVSIKKNFIMNAILTMSSIIFPLISFPYVSRILGPDGIGKVSFAVSFVMYFDIFAQLGIPSHGIRECAKVRDDVRKLSRVVAELVIINCVMTFLIYTILFCVIFLVPSLRGDKTLYIICSMAIILNTIGMNWLFQGLEKYTYITVRSLIFKGLALVGMFLLIKSHSDYEKYAGLVIFSGYASNVLNLIYAKKLVRLSGLGGLDFRRHFKPIGVFFASSCATTIYLNLDNVMLGFIKSKTDVGYYNAAVKVKMLLVNMVTALGTVLLPRLSYYVEHRKMDKFKAVSGKALHFVLVVSIPLMVYFIIFANPAIMLLSGRQYSNAVLPMQIIMPTLVFIGITNIMGIQILVPLGMEKLVLFSEIGGAITDIILNAALIPFWGASGAALGTAAAEIVVLIIQYRYLHKLGYLPSANANTRLLFGATAAAAAASAPTYLFGFMDNMRLETGSALTIIISGSVFFTLYGTILLIFKDSVALEMCSAVQKKLRGL